MEASSSSCPSEAPAPTRPPPRKACTTHVLTYLQPQQMGLPHASRPPTARPRKEGSFRTGAPAAAHATGCGPQRRPSGGLAWESPPPAPRDPSLCCLCSAHTHTCTLTHTHTSCTQCTYACTHRRARTYMHAHTQAHTCTLPSRCTRMHSHGRACISIQGTLTSTPLMHTCSYTCNSTHTRMHTHTCMHARTSCTHARSRTFTHITWFHVVEPRTRYTGQSLRNEWRSAMLN